MGDLDRNAILRMNDQNPVHALIRWSFVSSPALMSVSAPFPSGVYCLGLDVGPSWAAVTRRQPRLQITNNGSYMLRLLIVQFGVDKLVPLATNAALEAELPTHQM